MRAKLCICTALIKLYRLSFLFQMIRYLGAQWGSEIWTSRDFELSKRVWVANGPDLEWDLKLNVSDFEWLGLWLKL